MKGFYKSFVIFVIFFTLVHGRRARNPCEAGKVPCDNGECIGRWDWCDGDSQCADESDEKYCQRKKWYGTVPNNNCNEKHFVCSDGMCLPAALRCDQKVDCYDSSDETDCDPDQDELVKSNEKEAEYVSTASTPTREEPENVFTISATAEKETEYLSTVATSVQKEPKFVSTARTPTQKEPEFVSTTSTPARKEIYATSHLASTDGFYDNSRTDESYNNKNNRRYDYNPSSPNIDSSYAPPAALSYNFNQRIPYYLRYPEHPYYPRYPEHHYYPRYLGRPYDPRYDQTYYDSRYLEQSYNPRYPGRPYDPRYDQTYYYWRYPEQPYNPGYPERPYDPRYPDQTYYDSRYPEQPYDSRYLEQNNRRSSDMSPAGNFPSIQQLPTPETTSQEMPYRSPSPSGSRQDPARPNYPYWLSYIAPETPVQWYTPGKGSGAIFTATNLNGGRYVTIEKTWLKIFFNF